jgi:Reverse transcriptase (RNA-dependent DNA polymerase)
MHNIYMANSVTHPVTGATMEYRQLITDPVTKDAWLLSSANEFGRLAQGVGGRIDGTNTIRFIPSNELPQGRQATYPRFVCTERPQKTERNRTRLTLGGNLINYPGDVSVGTAELDTTKILLNSVVSTPEAKFCTADVTNFYLNTPMEREEYVRIPLNLIPPEIIQEYKLQDLVDSNGSVLARVDKGMYGLPQAGMLANKLLKERLAKHGYFETRHTPGLWTHKTRPIILVLVVDDFGIQYVGKEHAHHLIAALKQDYEAVTTDWAGDLFCGITLTWDYDQRTVDLSMPGYVEKALKEFQKEAPMRPEHQPYRSKEITYGIQTQLTDPIDLSEPLDSAGVLRLQRITGTFLYYARAVDPTMLVTLSALASYQSKATEQTAEDAVKFLNYCATHPDAILRYSKSDMILTVHSDASYLSESKARSRAGGFFYMGSKQLDAKQNGAILATTTIMKSVLSSAAEAEIGALFENCKKATVLRTTLDKMGWPQPATPMQTDNSTACGIANNTIKQQRSRAIDMRFYWVRDHTKQGHFNIFWRPGSTNLADYFTKHHPAKHHQLMRHEYLHVKALTEADVQEAIANALLVLQGCMETPANAGQTRTLSESSASQNQRAQADVSCITNGNQKANGQMANNGRLRCHAIL